MISVNTGLLSKKSAICLDMDSLTMSADGAALNDVFEDVGAESEQLNRQQSWAALTSADLSWLRALSQHFIILPSPA